MSIDTNILNKMLANWIQQYIKKIIHHDYTGWIQGSKYGSTLKDQSMWYSIFTNLKDKNHRIISIDPEKAFDRIQHLFMIKTLHSGHRGNIPKDKKGWTLFSSPVTATTGCCFCFGSIFSFFWRYFSTDLQ